MKVKHPLILQPSILDALAEMSAEAKVKPELMLREIFHILSGKGYAALLIVLGLPFCLPVQIPGVSTPFGIILAFLGLRIAFAKKLWWPNWVLEKKLASHHVERIVQVLTRVLLALRKVVHPRLQIVTQLPLFHRLHGLLVFALGIFLALPLPIPFTNLLTAIPIVLMGIGLLEDDGVAVLLAYAIAISGFFLFIELVLYGSSFVTAYLSH